MPKKDYVSVNKKQLLGLDFIIDQLSDFYEPQEARLWMFSRQKLLGGEVPGDLIQRGRVDAVLTAVNQLRDGVLV